MAFCRTRLVDRNEPVAPSQDVSGRCKQRLVLTRKATNTSSVRLREMKVASAVLGHMLIYLQTFPSAMLSLASALPLRRHRCIGRSSRTRRRRPVGKDFAGRGIYQLSVFFPELAFSRSSSVGISDACRVARIVERMQRAGKYGHPCVVTCSGELINVGAARCGRCRLVIFAMKFPKPRACYVELFYKSEIAVGIERKWPFSGPNDL